jgi:hypothetical protein
VRLRAAIKSRLSMTEAVSARWLTIDPARERSARIGATRRRKQLRQTDMEVRYARPGA